MMKTQSTNLNELGVCWRLWPSEIANISNLLYSWCLRGLFLSMRTCKNQEFRWHIDRCCESHLYTSPLLASLLFLLWNVHLPLRTSNTVRSVPRRSVPSSTECSPKVLGSVQSQDPPFPRDRRWPRPHKAGPPRWPSHLHRHAWHRHNSSWSGMASSVASAGVVLRVSGSLTIAICE